MLFNSQTPAASFLIFYASNPRSYANMGINMAIRDEERAAPKMK